MNSFIKSLMDERHLKQKELADILGVSSAAVSQWKDDGTNISVDCLFVLSKLFHVTIDEILEGKRTGESIEDKWSRDYVIDDCAASDAMINHDKDTLLKCLENVAKANQRFFILFEKKILGKITGNELKEWMFLRKFYDINIRRCHLFDEIISFHVDDIDEFILNNLTKKYGANNLDAILWEVKKIYKIEDFHIDFSILCDFDDDLFYRSDIDGDGIYCDEDILYAWFNIQTPTKKDEIVNDALNDQNNTSKKTNLLCELIKRGGNILYTPVELNITNYDYDDLSKLEGEVRSIPELDKAHAVIYDLYDNYSYATYEQYQLLINRSKMKRIEMAVRYKDKDPVKYWNFIKEEERV